MYGGTEESNNGIQRGEPKDVAEERKALVASLCDEVKQDKERWASAFKRMRADMKFVRHQLAGETDEDERAKANIIQRHVKQRVASLYAKNPTFIAKRRRTLDFTIWDGKKATLEKAAMEFQGAMQTGMPPSPETVALMQDVQQGIQKRAMLDRVGKTLEVLLDYVIDEQPVPFKSQCKQLVRRSVTCSVGYVKLAFQRQLTKRPDIEASLKDITDRLANVERLTADAADNKIEPNSAEAERLRLTRDNLQRELDVVVREGLVFDFPSPLRIIPDRDCMMLAPGFPGCRRVTEEFLLTCDQIKETYGVDVGENYTGYKELANGAVQKSNQDSKKALVYEIYDRKDGLLYVVCEGYSDFLVEPSPPPLPYLETFFPFLPLVFNAMEEECEVYPESDVRLLRPLQREINRKYEAVRQHRIANRPLYISKEGTFEEDDAKAIAKHDAHDVISVKGLTEGQDVNEVIQPLDKVGVDPNLYETGTDIALMQLIVGAQEANLGGTGGDSATESSIAENSRLTTVASEIDDLDDFLSILARLSGQVLLREMSEPIVKQVCGPGAVWPTLTNQQIAEELYLEIQAGSSGRPNKERDLANFERVASTMVQIPGINPEWFARYLIQLLDNTIDWEEAVTAGLPSITSMNRMTQPGAEDPANSPDAQGEQGGQNAPNDDTSTGGPQAALPAPDAAQPNVMA